MKDFLCSSIGKKYLMGISGLIWSGFVLAHMAGNLLIFVSADAYNKYGHFLTSGYFIYVAEALLIAALATHVLCAISLTRQNRQARPQNYAGSSSSGKNSNTKSASVASRTMAVQGSLILVFIITHIITFKFGTYHETTVDGIVMRDLHRLVIEVFQQPVYVIWYSFCLVLLGFHLSHGVGSIFQSFGLLSPQIQPTLKKLSYSYALIVVAGFLSQPLYAFLAR